ncbi:serine threonine- kinase SMG1-like [Olea europaea subsp. europaea]|nr:serine threonine- kinase SMG1-like [Olea europaea subsp. europaea]
MLERYALPILKACQELLEDERTSMSLLNRLLGVLTLISLKFYRCFQPHFVDIVDLLLGWAMVPDIRESDRRVIIDSFLQFQKHWVNNMQFSLGLLSKFLGDLDVLLVDVSPGTPQQFKRLLALLSCFCTVLQSVASGLLEINLLEQIIEPLSKMVPVLLGCLSMVGKKFGWSKWIDDSWRCLTLLAEILSDGFSTFYPNAVDLLFQSLQMEVANQLQGTKNINSFLVHGVLKTNLQMLSLQKLGLLPSSVQKVLRFDGPVSQLRLHPNHLVTGSAAATYIFLLQHEKMDVVENAIDSLIEELQLLKRMLGKKLEDELDTFITPESYSKSELVAMVKFDLKVLLSCIALGGGGRLIGRAKIDTLYVCRAEKLATFIIEMLDPFHLPIKSFVDLQVNVLKTLETLTMVEFLSKRSIKEQDSERGSLQVASQKHAEGENEGDVLAAVVFGHLRRYTSLLVKALDISSPLGVKIAALEWINKFCENVINTHKNISTSFYPCQAFGCIKIIQDLLFSTLAAASDREPRVRSHVASVLDMLLQAKVIHPMHFSIIAETILEKLGDPDNNIKNVYLKLLSHVLPITTYTCGLCDYGAAMTPGLQILTFADRSNLHWKQVFALKQLPQQLHSQQLVSILSYISQRWKAPLSSWIQRLIHTCRSKRDLAFTWYEETKNADAIVLWLDAGVEEDTLERICSVNIVAGAWWAIHEAARFCINTRLRTNLGGPTQTFAALERMLVDIAHVLQLNEDQNDGNLNVIGSYAHLLPMRLLLEFVEALKKNVYNAYEGSAVLQCASRQSSLFFRANKRVCEEWFSRICDPMMNAGLALQSHDATIHYCTSRLQDLRNLVASALTEKSRVHPTENLHNIRGRYAGDILRVLQHMALALCKNYEPEALVGLEKWATMAFSPLFTEENPSPSDGKNSGFFAWISGLVYQARGQHEKAAAHFIHLLQTEESLTSMGSDGVQFAIARIIENYTAVSDWKSLESWLLELQIIRAKHAGKSYTGALTTAGNEINSIQALARFDEGEYQAAWACLDLTPKSSNEPTLDPKLALQRSEQMLLQALLLQKEGKVDKMPYELQKAKLMLEETLSVLPLDGLVEAAAHVNQLHCISELEGSCELRSSNSEPSQSLLSSYIQTGKFGCNRVHQDCNLWLKVMRVRQNTLPTALGTLELCKNLSSLARKQSNLMLANRLNNYLKVHVSSCSDESSRDYMISSLHYENILFMHSENKLEDALVNLWSFVHPYIDNSSVERSNSRDSFLKAKACLKLANWLRGDCSGKKFEDVVVKMLTDFNFTDDSTVKEALSFCEGNLSSGVNLIVDELVGTLKKMSARLCPMMGKSWISYASWCYAQAVASVSSNHESAQHSCSRSPVPAIEIQQNRFRLTEEEQLHIKDIINKLVQEGSDLKERNEDAGTCNLSGYAEIKKDLKPLLHQIVDVIESTAGAPGILDCSGISLSATLSSQLHKCLVSNNVSLDEAGVLSMVNDLVEVWQSFRRRRVSLFGHAAQAFINYLSHSSLNITDGQLTGCDVDSQYKSVSYTLRATLYVLHILLNYGVELKDTLEPGLSIVPLLPWQEIIPQLFARLSAHPEQVVRKQLENLLVMLAKLFPWSIVYPTLVDANAYGKKSSEEILTILAYLNKLYPRLVQDAQLIIRELENVTVLWEELWLSTLQDLHADVMRRINLLKEEAARIAESTTLSPGEKIKINAAKYSAMMAPIIVVLERRLASTSRKPETPHEMWFFEEYQEQIKTAVTKFKTPPASAVMLGDVWRPFENVAASLASHQRKSSISLGEVAPHLAWMSSSDAPMPGLEKQITMSESERDLNSAPQEIVTIASFSEQVVILSTKTKPKKLVLMGSDGQKYTYLLKGREDLRLDARIMQLLQAVNGFLHSSSATRSRSLGIRHYSVTPISGRAGLIRWVDNVISIYSVFKSWQNRVQLAQISALSADTKNMVPPPVPRPSDMFYGKIIPALKEKGIRRVISRRDWPHDVKRKVLLDLMEEAPKQLLHQELWCASEGFKAFSSKLKRYSGSLAAMSIVGHILGLGDRHLDNILIDFCSGDIVHIDYNVCFDKGHRLKIPEIVPFRLTQTIEAALGLTGVEGTFRANCEAVLGVLKKNKDIVLMLLEVFVWDPLVEWTRANFHDDAAIVGEERKGMELAVSLSLFASRVQEIRVPLQEHHDLLLATLPAVESTLERFADILNQYEVVSSLFYHADQERSNLLLHKTSANSIVAEATCNSEKSRALFELQAREFSQAQAMIVEKGREASTWIEQHGRILDALSSSSIPEIKACIKLTGSEEALSLTFAVLVAGVPLTVVPEPTQVQCHDIDREVSHLVAELDSGLSSAVAALQLYSLALQRILPLNYIITSPVHGWAQILLSLNALSSDVISVARRQGAELIMTGHGDGYSSIKSSYDDLCLKVAKYAEDIERLEEECAELVNSIGTDTELKSKERLLSAFMDYAQHASLNRRDNGLGLGPVTRGEPSESALHGENEEKKERVLIVLDTATSNLFYDVKHLVNKGLNHFPGERNTDKWPLSDLGSFFNELEEHIEKCVLVTEFLNELKQSVGQDNCVVEADAHSLNYASQLNWASFFKTTLIYCKNLVWQMIEVVLPSLIKSIISFNSEVMDVFGSVSQIRGSIDTALEQLIEVELERASLIELEQNYFVKVGLITEQQLALEEAAVKGRDHLSWEEAEELASQEEACREQLDKLNQMWSQKDLQTSSLLKKETSINSTLASSELQLQSLIAAEPESEPHIFRSKALLAALVQPFAELESVDPALTSFSGPVSCSSSGISHLADLMSSGCPISEYIWKFPGILCSHAFFIWKVSIVDLLLDSCTHDVDASFDQNLGFDQLVNVVKTKVKIQLQEYIEQYLKSRVAPILLTRLDREIEILREKAEATKDVDFAPLKTDFGAVKEVQLMLEEYCNAHETVRAAKSAASVMKRQVNELKEALLKTSLEIVQMEWMHDIALSSSQNSKLISLKILADDDLLKVILNISRPKLLENIQSSIAKISKSLECLQSCEQTSITAEGQLERAMSWACGGPNSMSNISARNSGIPHEFHDHLARRRQLLQEAQENVSDIMKVCSSILEFEASRDGTFRTSGEVYPLRTSADAGMWQQAYLNAITKLDVTYHSFTRAEQEWKLAQSNMEAASSGLVSATNELRMASDKAKSASGDLQSTLLAMKDSAYEASVALSAFGGIIRGHSALTSECGSMLEEVKFVSFNLLLRIVLSFESR